MTKVSVIIPVYNVEKYLRECLDSVVNQSLKDIEIICVDDGSTDNSLSILQEYAAKDKRFKIFTQKNKGAATARNKGLRVAKSEYLYFMDSDDYLELEALEKIYKKITETNADICIFKNRVYNQSTGEFISCNWENSILNIPNKKTFNKYDIPNVFFQCCNIPAWSKMYKTSFIKKNNIEFQNLKTCNDVYFNYTTLALADSISFLDETLHTWRTAHTCTTTTRGQHIYCVLSAFKELKKQIKNKKLFTLLSDTFYKQAVSCFNYEVGRLETQEQKTYWTLKLFKFIPKQYWPKGTVDLKQKEYIQNLLSLKNIGVHKVFCIAGIKFKFKSKKLVERERYNALEKRLNNLDKEIEEIKDLVYKKEAK